MATQTHIFAEFSAARCEIDVNDANWRIGRARVINNSVHALQVTVLKDGAQVYTATAPANETTTWNIPGWQVGWDSVDGGIIWNGYELHARYPA